MCHFTATNGVNTHIGGIIFSLGLVSRGSIAGLRFLQDYAQRLLATSWEVADLRQMGHALIARHLSPGGGVCSGDNPVTGNNV